MDASPRPTLSEVARLAGVSVASVSRVLNDLPASDDMIARVRAAVAETDYVPHAVAQSLKAGSVAQLAFVVADIGNPVYATMMRAVEATVRDAGYRLLVSSIGAAVDDEIAILSELSHGFADGVIISPLRVTDRLLDKLASVRVPLVVIGTVPDNLAVDNVRVDSNSGVESAVRHLVDSHRVTIGFINGPADTVPGAVRRRGYESALRAERLPRTAALYEEAHDFTFSDGYNAAGRLLDRQVPDALLCANDLLAVGALNALQDRQIVVPDDVAVVGMDNTDLATMVTPSLTSVDLASAERGQQAAELLLDRLSHPGRPPKRLRVTPSLRVRASSIVATGQSA